MLLSLFVFDSPHELVAGMTWIDIKWQSHREPSAVIGQLDSSFTPGPLLRQDDMLYGECMARFVSTTVRLDEEDVRALRRARAAGISASDLIRRGLRVVASRYYSGRRPPSTLLFESTNSKLGDESELFRDID